MGLTEYQRIAVLFTVSLYFIGLTDALRTYLRFTSEAVRLRLTVFAFTRLKLPRLDLHLTMTWVFHLLILLRLAKINLRFTKA